MSEPMDKLTPKQIENWRGFLCLFIGVQAFFMTDEVIQTVRDQVNDNFTREGGSRKPVPLPFLHGRV